ncbi:hypothetical protein Taro_028306 [Colocasia esculenta]|uniref:Uncharacterized protein n=1 Tax=Colocasia esculenta TaxID=4460 RepID=A0A843VKR7_COLES|nr:hypothetical protein [Colocasia esculenta]
MHGRHRSPGDRSAPAGAGAAHSGYRGFGRGGGGYRRSGQQKPSSYRTSPPQPLPPPPPPPRRPADVLLEAGRLAAEYLVAKGLLPASSLPPITAARAWLPEDSVGGEGGRASALSRLSRRRLDDEDAEFEARNQKGRGGRRRQRNGSYNRHGSEWGRENGRGGPWPDATWADRTRGYSDAMDRDDLDRPLRWSGRGRGFFDGEYLDRRGGFEEDTRQGGGSINGGEGSIASTTDEPSMSSRYEVAGQSESEPESDGFAEVNGYKSMNNSAVKGNRVLDAADNLNRKSYDVRASDLEMVEAGELRDDVESSASGEAQMKKGLQEDVGDLAAQRCPVTEDKQPTNEGVSLLSFCGFAKVPTKPRSMATNRSPKGDQARNAEVGKDTNCDASVEGVLGTKMEKVSEDKPSIETLAAQPKGSRGFASEIYTQTTSGDPLRGQPQSSRGLVPKVSLSPSAPLGKESMEHDLMSSIESRCATSSSFPDSTAFVHEQQETSRGPPGFEFSEKAIDARVDGLVEHAKREGMKQMREWSPSFQSQTDLCFHDLRSKPSDLPAEKLPDHEMVDAVEDEQLRDADAFPKLVVDSNNKLEKERQLASSSFKICDLNLMEAPEVAEIPNDPPLAPAPLVSSNNPSMDFGLSIGQQCNDPDGYGHCSSDDKIVPVIDVEDDSPLQVMTCDASKTGTEPEYPNLENFLNHPENPVDMPDIQDGYSLAISEFLGNDMAGCTAVQGDISNLQAGMPFHGAEGITGVDDPLYVALAELPIGFMDVWDQTPPEYGLFLVSQMG